MNILLVNPPNSGRSIPEEEFGITTIKKIFRGEPLGLEVLAGNLEGHDVRIVDLKAGSGDLASSLNVFRPDIVGITALTCEANTACRIASEVKETCGATVVVGGIHASCDPVFFNRPEIDYIVVGIGKASFRELVDTLERGEAFKGITGVAKTDPSGLSFLPRSFSIDDLVEAKPPRYDLVSGYRSEYRLLEHTVGFVVSAYGCPYDCNFCCIASQAGGRYIECSIDSVIRDICLLGDVEILRLVDANTFGNPAHALKLCRAIKSAGIEKSFIGDIRSDTVVRHPEMVQEWGEAGLRSVVIGFEEISETGLSRMNKANTVAANIEAISILRQLGIRIVGDFIVSPDYDHNDFDNLIRFLEANPIDLPIFTIMTPLPGTPDYKTQREKIVNHDLDYYTLCNAVVPTLLPEEIFYRRYAELFHRTHTQAKI